MNREQANQLRATMGLPPLETSPVDVAKAKARKRAQDANRAAHAQFQRDLKSLRSGPSKRK